MNAINTKYGTIKDYLNLEMHSSGQPASLLPTGYAELETPYGTFIPQYEVEDMGRKEHKYTTFYSNGTIRRIPLQEKQDIETSYGTMASEMLLFYKNGALKKLFPLTGKLSGYWSEENEYALAENLSLTLPSGKISAKIISLGFFESGAVRSITFWPKEIVPIDTPIGTIEARTGIAFYEDGNIRSLEPHLPTPVKTPIGTLEAFDNDPEGISGDTNSLCFDRDGNISALSTISNKVVVTIDSDTEKTFEPSEKESLCSGLVKVAIPLCIDFMENKVQFNKSSHEVYDLSRCSFKVEKHVTNLLMPSYECA